MKNLRIPVIVGIGEFIDKSSQTPGLEPLDLLERALRAADDDAGGGWLRQIDTLRVVNQMTWTYRDLPASLAKRVRARSVEGIYGPLGGESPVRFLVDAAQDIAAGQSEVAVVCGAEALKTLMSQVTSGKLPAWTDADIEQKRLNAEDLVSPLAARYGLIQPIDVYPIYDNACRAAWKQSFAEAQLESATIFARNCEVAARNPYAWSGKPMSAEQIAAASPGNRPVAWPYTKFMCAQLFVNQSSAVILTDRARALEMGIAEERLVYVWAGAGAHEPYDFLRRDRYDHAPALEQVLRRTLELNRIAAADIDLHELYSCFPCVPKLSRRVLGLAADAQTSVCGGLTFFGGPGNNYMGHAITAMVRAMRAGQGRIGLLHGNGEYVTKHHAAILARTPPPSGVSVANTDLQAEVDAAYGPVPELVEDYAGPATIETYTVTFHANGRPNRGVVISRTPDGRRVLGRVTEAEPEALAFLTDPAREPIGAGGTMYPGGDGWNHWARRAPDVLPEPAVKFEKLTPHIALITLNRPDKRNAVNGAVTRLMCRYVREVDEDPEIRVAILAAAGDKSFCAGADLAEVSAGRAEDLTAGGNHFAGFVNAKRRKIWIAAVRGSALGGGTELALACDLVVAGESASFGLPEVKRSLIAAAGGLYRLPRAIAPRTAMELVLTGEAIDSLRALELNLVNRRVADAQVLGSARELAQSIADNAPLAVQASRAVVAACFDRTDAELSGLSQERFVALMSTQDFAEGPRAFLEKRKPEWRGR